MELSQIKGIIPPILTPMRPDESLDLEALGAEVERQRDGCRSTRAPAVSPPPRPSA